MPILRKYFFKGANDHSSSITACEWHSCDFRFCKRLFFPDKMTRVFPTFFFISLFFIKAKCEHLFVKFIDVQIPELKLSKLCNDDLNMVRDGISDKEIWALKVQDASGNPSTGFVWGNNFWLGYETECSTLNYSPNIKLAQSVTRKMFKNSTEIASKVPIVYRMFYYQHSSTIQFDADIFNQSVIHIGICFPQSCSDNDSFIIGYHFAQSDYFSSNPMIGDVKFLSTKTLSIRKGFFKEPFVVLML